MRISGFIIGGLVGAAAATYWARSGRTLKDLTDVNWNQIMDKAGDFAQSAKTMWENRMNSGPSMGGEDEGPAAHH